jgi:flagellar operon protein
MSFRINSGYISPTQKTGHRRETIKPHSNQSSFQSILDREIQRKDESIKISGHASRRLMERNITLNENDMQALSRAMTKADAKGAKDSLMLYKDIAFIASIKNRTLITAIDPQDSEENIFTNIDSAVIVK